MCAFPQKMQRNIFVWLLLRMHQWRFFCKKTTLAKTGVDDHQGGSSRSTWGVCRGQLHGNCISQSLASKRHSQCLQTVKIINLFAILVRRLTIMTFACKKTVRLSLSWKSKYHYRLVGWQLVQYLGYAPRSWEENDNFELPSVWVH